VAPDDGGRIGAERMGEATVARGKKEGKEGTRPSKQDGMIRDSEPLEKRIEVRRGEGEKPKEVELARSTAGQCNQFQQKK